jgi:hypothetical protein
VKIAVPIEGKTEEVFPALRQLLENCEGGGLE